MTAQEPQERAYSTFRCGEEGKTDVTYYLSQLGHRLWEQRHGVLGLHTHLVKDFPDTTLDDCVAMWLRKGYIRCDDHEEMRQRHDPLWHLETDHHIRTPVQPGSIKPERTSWENQRTLDLLLLYDTHRDAALEIVLSEKLRYLTPDGVRETFDRSATAHVRSTSKTAKEV